MSNAFIPLGSVPASSEDEEPPDPAVVLEDAISDVRKLIASGAPVLDIPIDLLQEACGNVAAAVSDTPKMSPTKTAPAGHAELDVPLPESESTVPDPLGLKPGDDVDGHLDQGSNDAHHIPPGGGAAGGFIEEEVGGDEGFPEFEDESHVVEDRPYDDGEAQQGRGCSNFLQQEEGGKGFVEVEGLGVKPSKEMDNTEEMILGADGDSPMCNESTDLRESAIAGTEAAPTLPLESANAAQPPPPSACPGPVSGELAASATDTEQAAGHEKEGSENGLGCEVRRS